MIWEAHDSPGYKLTLPTASKSEPARAAVALIAAGLRRSGPPQLASTKAIAIKNNDREECILLIGSSRLPCLPAVARTKAGAESNGSRCSPLLDKLFSIPGHAVQDFFRFQTPNQNRSPAPRQFEIPVSPRLRPFSSIAPPVADRKNFSGRFLHSAIRSELKEI